MSVSDSVLTSFTYANNKPYVVSRKSLESSVKVLKDLADATEDEPTSTTTEPPKEDWDEEDEEQDEESKKEELGQENVKTALVGDEDDDIEWSGDELELSREISLLEQSMTTSKREHSPTKSPRKRKPH